ncbi:MAG: hypothetical protein ACYDCK_06745 [Thermoplasmatota archaeon]
MTMFEGTAMKPGFVLATVGALAYLGAAFLDETLMMPVMLVAVACGSIGLAVVLIGFHRRVSLAPLSGAFVVGLALLVVPRAAWLALGVLDVPLDGLTLVNHATLAAPLFGAALAVISLARVANDAPSMEPSPDSTAV